MGPNADPVRELPSKGRSKSISHSILQTEARKGTAAATKGGLVNSNTSSNMAKQTPDRRVSHLFMPDLSVLQQATARAEASAAASLLQQDHSSDDDDLSVVSNRSARSNKSNRSNRSGGSISPGSGSRLGRGSLGGRRSRSQSPRSVSPVPSKKASRAESRSPKGRGRRRSVITEVRRSTRTMSHSL